MVEPNHKQHQAPPTKEKKQALPALSTVESASLTIVGGQPRRMSAASNSQVPRGVENVLLLAAQDHAFKEVLLANRSQALEQVEFALESSEIATLLAVSNTMLQAMIGAFVPRFSAIPPSS